MELMSRDPFAREELHRDTTEGECSWCGGTNARGKVYRYHIETDGGREVPLPGLFCSESCRKSYGG